MSKIFGGRGTEGGKERETERDRASVVSMVVVPIELEDDARFAGGRVDQGSQEETAVSGKLPIWTALELQGELNRWKVETSNSRSSKYFEDDDNMMNLDETETQESKPMPLPLPGKDPAELRLFASTFIGGLQFGLFKIDHKVRF